MTKQNGFNLMELMIVIAIMAILAAVAIPSYGRYISRSRAISAVVITDPVRTSITEYAMIHNGDLSGLSNASLNMSSSDLVEGSKDVSSVTISSSGANTAEIGVVLADSLGTLTWTGAYNTNNGHITWNCTYPQDSPLSNYAPNGCTAN